MHKVHVHDEFTLKSLKLIKVTVGKVMREVHLGRLSYFAIRDYARTDPACLHLQSIK